MSLRCAGRFASSDGYAILSQSPRRLPAQRAPPRRLAEIEALAGLPALTVRAEL